MVRRLFVCALATVLATTACGSIVGVDGDYELSKAAQSSDGSGALGTMAVR